MKLTPRGRELARTKSDDEPPLFGAAVDSIVPYRSAIEWMFHQDFESVTNAEVAAHWHEHHGDTLGTENENTIRDNAVCFFHLAQAAQLGNLVLGRRTKPTRFVIDRAKLKKQIEAGPSAPPWVDPSDQPEANAVEETDAVTAEPVQFSDAHATPSGETTEARQKLIIAALDTGCRLGELLSMQWWQVSFEREGSILIPADKAKTSRARTVPITKRLRTELMTRQKDPAGQPLPPESFVLGNEVGEAATLIRTAWESTLESAQIKDLHFHDLRRENGRGCWRREPR